MKLDCTKYKTEDEARSSFVAPGRYHVQIQNADDSFTKYPNSVVVTFELLNGTVPGQDGKKHTEFFSTSEKALERLQCFAIAAGLVTPGEGREINFATDAPSKQLVIELEENQYEKKDGSKGTGRRITYKGMWSVGHKDVADVPKDREMIALIAKVQAAGLVSHPVATCHHAPTESADPWGSV